MLELRCDQLNRVASRWNVCSHKTNRNKHCTLEFIMTKSSAKKSTKNKKSSDMPRRVVAEDYKVDDSFFDDIKTSIEAAKNHMLSSLGEIVLRYSGTEEGSTMLDNVLGSDRGACPTPVELEVALIAVPKIDGEWGSSFDLEAHLDAFRSDDEVNGCYHSFFAHCQKAYVSEALMFITACNQLGSLEPNRRKYVALFFEIYRTFIDDEGALPVNLAGSRTGNAAKKAVMTTHPLHVVHTAKQKAREMLYNTVFIAFTDEQVYKNADKKHHVKKFKSSKKLDYWFHKGEGGFKDFKKFAKGCGTVAMDLLDFYTDCQTLQGSMEMKKFLKLFYKICETYILPRSDRRLTTTAELGQDLMVDFCDHYYVLNKKPKDFFPND